ncbi:energy-coupling factor transporter transmembrane component T [Anoxynatronum sibiricum]
MLRSTSLLVTHPGLAIVNAFVVLWGMVLLERPETMALLLPVLLLFLFTGNRMTPAAWWRLLMVLPMLLVLTLPLLIAQGWPPPHENRLIAATLALRIFNATLVLIYLGTSRSREALLEGLTLLKMPEVMTTILLLSFRYFIMVRQDVISGRRALQSRGMEKLSLREQLPFWGEWIGGFFLKASDHSEQVYRALKARSFNGHIPSETPPPMGLVEKGVTLLLILLFLCFIFLERGLLP